MSSKRPLSIGERSTPLPSSLNKTRSQGARRDLFAGGASPLRSTSPNSGQAFLDRLVNLQLLTPSIASQFLQQPGRPAQGYATAEALGQALVLAGLLTEYQVDRVLVGTTYGLVL